MQSIIILTPSPGPNKTILHPVHIQQPTLNPHHKPPWKKTTKDDASNHTMVFSLIEWSSSLQYRYIEPMGVSSRTSPFHVD